MTRFVYVLPAGRLRWEVRVDDAPCKCGHAEEVHNGDQHGCRGAGPIGLGLGCDCSGRYQPKSYSRIEPQLYRRKAHALIAARAIAIVIGGEVQPHNRWGRIQDPDSFGGDSPRRKG